MASSFDCVIAIGGAAGQGIATPGNTLARMFIRRGLHLNAYNAYQSIIRGGHILLTIRVRDRAVHCHGDTIDLLLCLNQDTMDRHLELLGPGSWAIYSTDAVTPGEARDGVGMAGLPVGDITGDTRNKLTQNIVALGAIAHLLSIDFGDLAACVQQQFGRKGSELIEENLRAAQGGYDYAAEHFAHWQQAAPSLPKPQARWSGNEALAMGGAAAGVKFYCAYPMSPSTGVLHWMAANARDLGIMVRQVEDEIGVANMAIGAAHTGVRAMCATSGGGFALMTEAVGAAAMMEIPVVFIDVMRAGPSTGVPTKTEQGDLWQALGASQGDFPRFIVAPRDALDAYNTIPELFNLCDRCQCPGIVISDLLISEGTFSVDPDELDFQPEIDRGALITEPNPAVSDVAAKDAEKVDGLIGIPSNGYLRYENTASGISPRAVPGLQGYVHVVATDEHDEDGVLVSDEYTNPHKRRMMADKRARKWATVSRDVPLPELDGPADAEVTLIGWGSTYGVVKEAVEQLAEQGIVANQLALKWLVPLHGDVVVSLLSSARRTIMVENNQSGQFERYLRSETGLSVDGRIRKYDGEPFMPHHIVDGVRSILAGEQDRYVPVHEIMV